MIVTDTTYTVACDQCGLKMTDALWLDEDWEDTEAQAEWRAKYLEWSDGNGHHFCCDGCKAKWEAKR